MSRVAHLRSTILKAKQAYYYGGQPILSDAEYDSLEDELRELAPDDPVLAMIGAPVPPDAMLTKARHRIPMGSQSKVNSAEEFRTWLGKSTTTVVHGSLKGDGASAAAYFRDGRLEQVISRGDGEVGEDVTANAVKFKGLPVVLPEAFTGAVRVEVILTVEDWGRVDPERRKNPRNAGAGIMGRKNGEDAELLSVYAFDIVEERTSDEHVDPVTFPREQDKTARLKALGFPVMPQRLCGSAEEAIAYYDEIVRTRDDLPFWIDGVVFKIDDLEVQRSLGLVANRPKGQIAWKFDSAGAETVLRGYNVSGGHTGALIPNAELEPVDIGGTTVKSASLANFDEVARLGVAVGDRVWVIKANDIIPKVIRVVEQGSDRSPIQVPTECPFCGGTVGRRMNTGGTEGTVIVCQNPECPKKSVGRVARWIKSVDIQGIGDSVRTALVDQLDLTDAADLYRLRERRDELVDLVINVEKDLHLGEKRTDTILAGIEAKRRLPLDLFLGSLGITTLGKRRAELIITAAEGALNQLGDWRRGKLRDSEFAEQVGVPNLGDAIQDGIDASDELIDRLLDAGVEVEPGTAKPGDAARATAAGPTVCISGKLPSGKKKKDYEEPLAAAGFTLVDKVTKELAYLVVANPESTSAKAKKARQFGVTILDEGGLEALLADDAPALTCDACGESYQDGEGRDGLCLACFTHGGCACADDAE